MKKFPESDPMVEFCKKISVAAEISDNMTIVFL